jgi:hypothetical protein
MDWIQIGTTFGVPVLLLVGIAWFVNSKVWPFVVTRIEQSDKRMGQFVTTLDEIKTNLRTNTEVAMETLKTVRGERERERYREEQRNEQQRRPPR